MASYQGPILYKFLSMILSFPTIAIAPVFAYMVIMARKNEARLTK